MTKQQSHGPKVYVVQKPHRLVAPESETGPAVWAPSMDLSPAYEFGEVINILPCDADTYYPAGLHEDLLKGLAQFREGTDYLLTVGDLLACTIAVGILARRQKTVDVLKWNSKRRKYVALTLFAEEQEHEHEHERRA